MAPRSKKILVLGATGLIGKVLLNALVNAKDNFERIGIFTSAETLRNKNRLIESFKSRGVDVFEGDLDNDDDVLTAYKGVFSCLCVCRYVLRFHGIVLIGVGFDTVVSAVGRFAINKQIDLIALAEKTPSIIRFIPSEYGTDIAYDASSAAEITHQKKLQVRSAMESASRLSYTYLVTGPFADLYIGSMANEPQVGSFDVVKREATLLGDGNGRVSLTTMADVGRLLIAVLTHPEVCDRRAVRVNSLTTTPSEILAEFERQTDSKWKASYTSTEKLRSLEDKAWSDNNPLATLYTLRRIWTEGRTLYVRTDNEVLELTKMDTLEMVVQEAVMKPVEAFQSGKM